ncbi:hypothetical protein MPSEU_000957200 [Mayamaea pseudoterrestris]|nr:hypothetical protein MPSEU_000957200 [Mayamaea pseudoterrestris]
MMLSTSATSWFRFYSDAKRSRSSYGNLANNSAAFSSVSLSDRHNALHHGPEDLYLVLGLKATKLDFLMIHHPIVYELEDGDDPVVFAFNGPSARANVVRLLPASLQVITDPGEAFFTPSFGMLLDDDAMNNFGADDYLGMAVDETNPLSFSASIPLPPFAFAVLEQFGSNANWQTSFLSFIECLSNYKDIHGDDIKTAAFLPARILWWLMKQANTTTPSAAYKAFIGRLPPLPVIEKLDEIPPPVIADFNEVTEHRLQRNWPSGAALKTRSDDTSKDDDENKDEEGSEDGNNTNKDSSKAESLAVFNSMLDELRRQAKVANEAQEARVATLERQNDEDRTLIATLSKQKGSSDSVGSWSKVLPSKQRLFLRLATTEAKEIPTEPSTFHTTLLSSKKDNAQQLLQAALDEYSSQFIIPSSMAQLIHRGDLPTKDRSQYLFVSLMGFTASTESINPSAFLEESMQLDGNDVRESTMKKHSEIKTSFPHSPEELMTGIEEFANVFDILAGIAPTANQKTYLGATLRQLAKDLKGHTKRIKQNVTNKPDFLAHLSNNVDVLINNHMLRCLNDTGAFTTTYLDKFAFLIEELNCDRVADSCIPTCLIKFLPSVMAASFANSANQKRFGGGGGGNGSNNNGGGHNGQDSPPKLTKTNNGSKAKVNQAYDAECKIRQPIKVVFPSGEMGNCPKVTVNGNRLQPCLKFFCSGKCTWKACPHAHEPLSQSDALLFKAFVKAQKQAHNDAP